MQELPLQNARILIVDDQKINLTLLERLLASAGFTNCRSVSDSREVFSVCEGFRPDIILLDLHMPYLDGFQVMEQLQPLLKKEVFLPILILTADDTSQAKKRALSAGAKDFLTKPFDATEALLRISNLLQTRFLYHQVQDQNRLLEEKVKERTQELESAHQQILQSEADKKQFYREVIRCVTHNKFHLADNAEIPVDGQPILDMPLTEPTSYPTLRGKLHLIARDAGMDEPTADDLVLATGEAVTNAIKHAVEGCCSVFLTPDRIIVRVCDHGKGIRTEDLPATVLMPGFSTAISLGMGYTLMLELVDRVWLATNSDGTVVQMEKWIHPEEHANTDLLDAFDRF
jgi:DNA-binding response OmpR family regulator/anti-sigma regulatory factor (Ser/Thr protein kinase)